MKKAKKDQVKRVKRIKGFMTNDAGSDVKDHSNDSDFEPAKPSQSGDGVTDGVDKMQEVEHAEDINEGQVTEDPDNTTERGKPEKPNNEGGATTTVQDGSKPETEEDTGSKAITKTSDPPTEAKEVSIHSGISQQANPDATPSSPAISDEEDEPLSIWKQKVTKKSK